MNSQEELRATWTPEMFNFFYEASEFHGETVAENDQWLSKATQFIEARERAAQERVLDEIEKESIKMLSYPAGRFITAVPHKVIATKRQSIQPKKDTQ
jgi:hypothetical protein